VFKTNFFLNPKREQGRSLRSIILYYLKLPLTQLGLWLGFINIEYSYVHGEKTRLKIGKKCSTMNTIFNVISGEIHIGDNTIFGHDCMVLTGTHEFYGGVRGSLLDIPVDETPLSGRDIVIGTGCFVGSGVIIQGKLSIGKNVLIASGSVVTKNLPDSCFVAGIPAKVIKSFND
jgi:acetyltransferase-like isoleucine patch superfamily enzyme